ncbi:N-(5'-phosphoribosyl)anthranilate isomerase [Roseomonas genomospecies 6]|uniref:N-(5'-phosphoribosyl)anthranilate isomerase n=1 Tax=Roseomonas genomospecies 6 TaxID=214106 RepID=A0A9W7TYY6_9PROT|nr:N-(5'-phosphoribosyl)anthranilate isomerase [Roseomonas genomospecies 6]KAA0680617.1 N-(5'-phosphoribosyl)anthranilate isomerase [Roseomonas genomospecies 6]
MRLKICGITQTGDIETLRGLPVDFIGLWHGVEGGHANLPLAELSRLAGAARAAGEAAGRLEPVLVTFLSDAEALRRAVGESGVRWVQLHGFQTPALVCALRGALPAGTRIVKVLHVHGDRCAERPLIRAYENAGVDLFLMDSATSDGRIGSTGLPLDAATALSLADAVSRPFFLAGGISADNQALHGAAIRHPRFFGIDVDSKARDAARRLCPASVAAITRNWAPGRRTAAGHE